MLHRASDSIARPLGLIGVALAAVLVGLVYVLLRAERPGSEAVRLPAGHRSLEDSHAAANSPMDLADAAQVARDSVQDSVQDPSGAETTDPEGQGTLRSSAWSASEAREELQRIDRAYQHYAAACETEFLSAPMAARALLLRCVAVQLDSRGLGEVMEGTGMRALPKRPDGERQFVVGNKIFVYTDAEYPELATLWSQVEEVSRSSYSGEAPRSVLDPELRAGTDRIVAGARSLLTAAAQ